MDELLQELIEQRDYLISQVNVTYEPDETNRLIGRLYQLNIIIQKIAIKESSDYAV